MFARYNYDFNNEYPSYYVTISNDTVSNIKVYGGYVS